MSQPKNFGSKYTIYTGKKGADETNVESTGFSQGETYFTLACFSLSFAPTFTTVATSLRSVAPPLTLISTRKQIYRAIYLLDVLLVDSLHPECRSPRSLEWAGLSALSLLRRPLRTRSLGPSLFNVS